MTALLAWGDAPCLKKEQAVLTISLPPYREQTRSARLLPPHFDVLLRVVIISTKRRFQAMGNFNMMTKDSDVEGQQVGMISLEVSLLKQNSK